MSNNMRPEDHAELQRLQAIADGSTATDAPTKRLAESGAITKHDLKRYYYAGGRRRNHLVRMIDDPGARGSRGHDYDRLELAFVEAGLEALHFWERHGKTAEDAMKVLRQLVMGATSEEGVDEAVERGHDIIDRFDWVGD
jgi:hypothetical protein